MKRGRKQKLIKECGHCHQTFERWRVSIGSLTNAKYCQPCCKEIHQLTIIKICRKVDPADVVRARLNNPCATLQSIGSHYGVTRERVRQVLARAGLSTKAFHQRYSCNYCGADMGTNPLKKFCSRECYSASCWIEIACDWCGQLKKYRAKSIVWHLEHNKQPHKFFFCSKTCNGKWVAHNYGWGQYWERQKELQEVSNGNKSNNR